MDKIFRKLDFSRPKVENERIIYLWILALIAFSFSLPRYSLRISEFILLIFWVFSSSFRQKLACLKQNHGMLILASFFIAYLIGVLNTPSFPENLIYLRKILPWLGLALFIGSYSGLEKKALNQLLIIYIAGVLLHTLASYATFHGMPWGKIEDFRNLDLYPNFSHHRFVLSIDLAIFFLAYLIYQYWHEINRKIKIAGVLTLFWLIYYLFFSKIITGIFIFGLFAFIVPLYFFIKSKGILRYLSLSFMLILILVVGFSMYQLYAGFWLVEKPDRQALPEKTENGNPYQHRMELDDIENGHFTWLYLNEAEMQKEWNERSDIKYNDKAANDYLLKYSLIRYLTSLGLTKDSAGVSQLDQSDIRAIEKGIANHRYKKFDLKDRFYTTAWELYHAYDKDTPLGTLTGRLFSYEHGFQIFLEQPVIGHGVRSLEKVFRKHYDNRGLTSPYYVPAHNQYLRFLIEFGILGLLWFLLSVFLPFIREKGYRYFLLNSIIAMIMIACFINNTLKSQWSLSFLVFFYGIFYTSLVKKDEPLIH